MRGNQRGFTLLEVLLAGFILFLVLTSMTLVYRGALLSSAKAEASLVMTAAVPSIRILITESIRQSSHISDHGGSGSFGNLDYQWVATLAYEGQPSIIAQEDARTKFRYYLWDIDINLSQGNARRNYQFREISW